MQACSKVFNWWSRLKNACRAEFAIVDEAYPFVAKMLLTDDSPRLRSALKYMVYGKDSVFDADRLIDLLAAFEDFSVASKSAQGDMDVDAPRPGNSFKLPSWPGKAQTAASSDARRMSNGQASTSAGYSQVGKRQGMSGGGNKQAGAGTYASVDGYGSVPASNGQGNGYNTSMSDGGAQHDRRFSNGNGANGMSNGTGATGIQPYSEQGRRVSSERADSGQHASSSNGGPWGSWGSWAPQVFHAFCVCC